MIFHRLLSVVEMSVIAVLLTAHCVTAQPINQTTAQPSADQEYHVIQKRPDRLFFKLPNDMLVIVQELRTAPVVTAQVWVKTGSIYEQQHVGAGLSHFLEHLLSGGSTSTRSEEENNRILGSIGAQTNAATGLETVNYYINTTSQHADTAVDLLSDWMKNSLIRPEEYERERQVIQREFEHGEGSPERLFWKLTQQARFQVHPARHPTIGYLDEFLKVSRDEIHAFYRKMYVPNNMVFVVVGDVDKEVIAQQITRLWKDVPTGKLPELSLPLEPKAESPRELSGQAAIDQPRLRIAWPGTQLGGEHDYALDLLANVLGDGESSRLAREVRDELRVVNSIGAYNLSFAWGEGFFGIDSTVTIPPAQEGAADDATARVDEAMHKAKTAILQQVERIRNEGVTQEELARAKRQQMAGSVYGSQTAQALASRVARDLIGMADPDYQERYIAAIEAITPEELKAAANAMLVDQRMITISLLPKNAQDEPVALTRPTDPTVKFETRPVDLSNSELLAKYEKLPKPEVSDRPAVEVSPLELHTLPNGLRLVIQRSTLVPAVAIQMYQLGGLLGEEPGREGVANAVSTMLLRGTTTRSAQDIAEQLESLGAALAPSTGNNTVYVTGLALKDDWQTVMELLADITLRPTFPADEWEKMQPRLLAAIDRQNDNWGSELRNRFRESYFNADYPWSQNPVGRRDVVASLDVKTMAQFHREHQGASQTVMAVIGDVDPATVLAEVTRLFAEMPENAAKPFEAIQAAPPEAGVYVYPTRKPMVGVQIGFGPGPERKSTDYAGLQVLVKVLSNFPTGWLEQELRGRGPGLVYAVGAGQFTGVVPGYVAGIFNTQPASTVEAVERASGVFARIRETQVDEVTLARAKAGVLTDEFMYKQSNGERATEAALNVLYGLGLEAPKLLETQVKEVTAASLQTIAKTYLRDPVTVLITHQPVDEAKLLEAASKGATSELKLRATLPGQTSATTPAQTP